MSHINFDYYKLTSMCVAFQECSTKAVYEREYKVLPALNQL